MNKKVYIVKDPDLILAVDRASKTLTFYPFISLMSPRLFDIGDRPMSIINNNIDLRDGKWGLCHDISQRMHAAMAPGLVLDAMNQAMLTRFLQEVDSLEQNSLHLFSWIRKAFSVSSTEAIYGPGNPFAKVPDLSNHFWNFDKGLAPLLFGIPVPSARKAHRSRAIVIKAMNEYFENGEQERGMPIIKARYEVGKKYGATTDDIARFEIGDCIGILVNATPALFWSMLHIYSDKSLLSALQEEVDAHIASQNSNDTTNHTIDVGTLQQDCPLLVSTFREVLRYHTHFSNSRFVSEETLLAERLLLKKGSVLLMPSGVAHMDGKFWGKEANLFNAKRFLKQQDLNVGSKSKTHAGAYRAWGGGANLCPGRFFATTEITSVLAMVVARYDIRPATGEVLVIPANEKDRVASSIPPPKNDVAVNIITRNGLEGHRWNYSFSTSSSNKSVED